MDEKSWFSCRAQEKMRTAANIGNSIGTGANLIIFMDNLFFLGLDKMRTLQGNNDFLHFTGSTKYPGTRFTVNAQIIVLPGSVIKQPHFNFIHVTDLVDHRDLTVRETQCSFREPYWLGFLPDIHELQGAGFG